FSTRSIGSQWIMEFLRGDSFSYRICDGACMLDCGTVQVKIRIEKTSELFIPNGVSADGDGTNDQWVIRGLEAYPENSVKIFNRWGQEVYRASPYENDWSGQGMNGTVTGGTYYYILDLGPKEGKKTGYIEFRK
ncbi:MAG: gliding motility-associated C-terminal domain-containing protein, partial [Flavobacteriales bacterium]